MADSSAEEKIWWDWNILLCNKVKIAQKIMGHVKITKKPVQKFFSQEKSWKILTSKIFGEIADSKG